jgi:succinate dehydrogenase hydrophobic anchor subunit
MVKWYYRLSSVIVALLVFGPLAFPLLWKSPEYNLFWKVLLTVAFTAMAVYLAIATWKIGVSVWNELKSLGLI